MNLIKLALITVFIFIAQTSLATFEDGFAVYSARGQKLIYNAEAGTLTYFKTPLSIPKKAYFLEHTTKKSTLDESNTAVFDHNLKFSFEKSFFEINIQTKADTLSNSTIFDTYNILNSTFIDSSTEAFFGHKFTYPIPQNEFLPKKRNQNLGFFTKTVSGINITYNSHLKTMELSSPDGLKTRDLKASYVRRYKKESQIVLHRYSVEHNDGYTYSVELETSSLDHHNLKPKDLLKARLIKEMHDYYDGDKKIIYQIPTENISFIRKSNAPSCSALL